MPDGVPDGMICFIAVSGPLFTAYTRGVPDGMICPRALGTAVQGVTREMLAGMIYFKTLSGPLFQAT